MPGASVPRLRLLRPQDFRSVFQAALRGQGHRSIVVVGNYEFGPITAEPCRAKVRPLRPRRSCFAPVSAISNQASAISNQASQGLDRITDPCFLTPEWWRRRVLPPGPIGLLRRPFIAIAGLLRRPQYSPEPPDMKALNVRKFAKPSPACARRAFRRWRVASTRQIRLIHPSARPASCNARRSAGL